MEGPQHEVTPSTVPVTRLLAVAPGPQLEAAPRGPEARRGGVASRRRHVTKPIDHTRISILCQRVLHGCCIGLAHKVWYLLVRTVQCCLSTTKLIKRAGRDRLETFWN